MSQKLLQEVLHGLQYQERAGRADGEDESDGEAGEEEFAGVGVACIGIAISRGGGKGRWI
jgi:hypothetical protein